MENIKRDPAIESPYPKLARLAINAEGFVFDPQAGDSFTVNSSGALIINMLAKNSDPELCAQTLQKEFKITINEARHDVRDFMQQLRLYKLISGVMA